MLCSKQLDRLNDQDTKVLPTIIPAVLSAAEFDANRWTIISNSITHTLSVLLRKLLQVRKSFSEVFERAQTESSCSYAN